MSSKGYTLTSEDVDPGLDGHDHPAVRAAANPNPEVLKAVLSRGWLCSPLYRSSGASGLANRYGPNAFMDFMSDGVYDSPLLRAIRCRLPENVDTLLNAGADANGLPLHILSESAEQASPSDANRHSSQAWNLQPFWADAVSSLQLSRAHRQAVVALEAAAAEGLNTIIEKIVAHGADISFWLSGHESSPGYRPGAPEPSSLSASSPLHAAILHNHNDTVAYLLQPPLCLNPNTIPPGYARRRITPLMQCLLTSPPNLEALDVIISHHDADPYIRTPEFGVSLIHFATARLSVHLIYHLVNKPGMESAICRAGTTAHGHTLLHLACLPYDETHFNVFSPKVYQSMRFVRTLNPEWTCKKLTAECPLKKNPMYDPRELKAVERSQEMPLLEQQDTGFFEEQVHVIRFLLDALADDDSKRADLVRVRDVDGNTALHHLAGHRVVNSQAVQLLRGIDEQDEEAASGIWDTAKNNKGHTPRDLFDDGKDAAEARHMGFWGEINHGDCRGRMPCYGCKPRNQGQRR